MMKAITLTIYITLALSSGFAQNNHYTDSIKFKLAFAKEDTNKVNIIERLTDSYAWSYPDSALAYAKQGLQLARELKFKKGEILIMINTGFAFGVKGDYAQSLSTLLNALQLAESLGNKNLIVKAKDAIGWSYSCL